MERIQLYLEPSSYFCIGHIWFPRVSEYVCFSTASVNFEPIWTGNGERQSINFRGIYGDSIHNHKNIIMPFEINSWENGLIPTLTQCALVTFDGGDLPWPMISPHAHLQALNPNTKEKRENQTYKNTVFRKIWHVDLVWPWMTWPRKLLTWPKRVPYEGTMP